MPHDKDIPGTPADWLARARSALALAKVPLPQDAVYEDLCFYAQQAAEKAFKAVYRLHGWRFRYVHDLEEMLVGLRQKGLPVPAELDDSVRLTDYAFATRYPGLEQSVSREEYERAVVLAEGVVAWAASVVEGGVP